MSREASDRVALAVDNKPVSERTLHKLWLASGAIVPPRDTGAPSPRWIGWFLACVIVGGIGMFLYGVTR